MLLENVDFKCSPCLPGCVVPSWPTLKGLRRKFRLLLVWMRNCLHELQGGEMTTGAPTCTYELACRGYRHSWRYTNTLDIKQRS